MGRNPHLTFEKKYAINNYRLITQRTLSANLFGVIPDDIRKD